MKDVFISYKTEEFSEALWVKETLETNGISCWMAPMSIPGGSNYAAEIPQAIRECKVFVLLLSQKCQESKWVPRELDQAINEGKTILPFMLENCTLKDEFNFYLSNVQRYEAYESKSKAIERMVCEIKAIIDSHNQKLEKPVATANSQEEQELKTVPENPEVFIQEEKVATPIQNEKSVKKPKKEKQKAVAHVPQKSPSKTSKKSRLPLLVAALLIAVVLSIVLFSVSNKVEIAGEKFKKSDYLVSLEGKIITQEDIDNISKFKDLDNVKFIDCEISATDLSVLEEVGYSLAIENCSLTYELLNSIDFTKSELKRLKLDDNEELKDITMLESLSDTLNCLSLNNCGLDDLSVLSDFTGLSELYADSNSIVDVEALADNTALKKLSLNNNKISDIDAFDKLINLTHIYLADNKIESLDGLKNTTLLTEVDFSKNKIEDISVLEKSADSLASVSIAQCGIANIEVLKDCTNLNTLVADGNNISDISVLKKLTNLEKVTLSDNLLNSASALEDHNLITHLDLSKNNLKEVSLSLRDADYIYLDLGENDIYSISLPSKHYNYLGLDGNEIDDLSGAYDCTGGKVVFDYNSAIDFLKLSESDFYDIYIIDCPLDKQVEISQTLGEYHTHFIVSDEVDAIKEAS